MKQLSRFHQEMDQVKAELLEMGALVEQVLADACQAITRRERSLAELVIARDERIDQLENIIEAHCIRLMATHQPVAVDLRFLAASLRIIGLLERSGDQAVNVAQRCLSLAEMAPLDEVPTTLVRMCEVARQMTRKALDALVRRDIRLAYEVCCQDDELDELNDQLLNEMLVWMMAEQRVIRRGLELILAGRHLERVGDQATDIAEEVVFMVDGRVIRHQLPQEDSR